jgi:hypothetical protein
MLVSIVGLNLQDLSVQYIRTEDITPDRELVLYENYEFIVPSSLNPITVKGQRVSSNEIVIVEDEERKYAWKELRRKRAQLLTESDWTQFSDVSMSSEKRNAWIVYRQLLRDIPYTIKDPLEVVWPIPPQ